MHLIKRYSLPAFSVCAAVYALSMIAFNWGRLIKVFQLGDPTGSFGLTLQVGAFVANICVIIIAALVIVAYKKQDDVPRKVALIIFGIKFLEALSLSPCAVGIGDAFCGFWWVSFAAFSSPILIIVALIFLFNSGKRSFVYIGVGTVVGVMLAGAAAFLVLTPKNPDACMAFNEVTHRAACLNKFALRDGDVATCRKIEFRSTRLSCLYEVAEATEAPEICEEINDPAGTEIAPYETQSSEIKNLCYFLVALKMQRQDLCQGIADNKMRDTCLKGARAPE